MTAYRLATADTPPPNSQTLKRRGINVRLRQLRCAATTISSVGRRLIARRLASARRRLLTLVVSMGNTLDGVNFRDTLSLVRGLSALSASGRAAVPSALSDAADVLLHAAIFRNGHAGTTAGSLAKSLAAEAVQISQASGKVDYADEVSGE